MKPIRVPACVLPEGMSKPTVELGEVHADYGVRLALQRKPEELADFSEAFLCGTAAEVTPVSVIWPYKFTPGDISRTLLTDYLADVQREKSVVEL